MSTISKEPDSFDCPSCGDQIAATLNSCPNCGEKAGIIITDGWQMGVYLAVLGWVALIAAPWFVDLTGSYSGLAFLFLTWTVALIPISFYFDIKYVKSVSDWNPLAVIYLLGSLVPFLNVYLGMRYQKYREQELGSDGTNRQCRTCSEPLDDESSRCCNCGTQDSSATRKDGSYWGVNPRWWNKSLASVVSCTVILILCYSLLTAVPKQGILGTLFSSVFFLSSFLLPICLWTDIRFVRKSTHWSPSRIGYILGSLTLGLNTFVAAVYLYRRHEVVGQP